MKAITTKYSGPTDTRGSRVTATDGDGHRASVPYDDSTGGSQGAHRRAALLLCKKMDWNGCERLVGGATHKSQQYAFVFVPSDCKCARPLEGLRGTRGRRSRKRSR